MSKQLKIKSVLLFETSPVTHCYLTLSQTPEYAVRQEKKGPCCCFVQGETLHLQGMGTEGSGDLSYIRVCN